MAKCIKKVLAVLFVMAVVIAVSVPAFAASNQVVFLPSNQIWTKGYDEVHDINYSKVGAMCHSVYPTTGADTFSRIQCKVVNTLDVTIVYDDYTILTEGASGYTTFRIKEGYLATATVYFKFRGNGCPQANAVVSYTGTIRS